MRPYHSIPSTLASWFILTWKHSYATFNLTIYPNYHLANEKIISV